MKKTYTLILIVFIALGVASCGEKKSQEAKIEGQTSEEQKKEGEETLKKVDIKDLSDNVVSLFADNWFVVTAGQDPSFNQMTISWGAIGHIWQFPATTIYIRKSRYTHKFLTDSKYYTLCAFDEEYRDKVKYIGSHTGSKVDKLKETGLTPLKTELGCTYYAEARLVIECEKIYAGDINPKDILDKEIRKTYKGPQDEQTMYIGKIVNVWEKK